MTYDWVISLGCSCQAVYQIRRHFKQELAFPLDWVISSYFGLMQCIATDFRGIIDERSLSELPGSPSIVNNRVGLLHVHDFEIAAGVRHERWTDRIPAVASKFDLLAARWNSIIQSDAKVLFVRHQGHLNTDWSGSSLLDATEANALHDLLRKKAPRLQFTTAFVSAVESAAVKNLRDGAFAFTIPYTDTSEWPADGHRWRGSSKAWSGVFDALSVAPTR